MNRILRNRIRTKLESIGDELFSIEAKVLSKRYNLPESIIREYRERIQSESTEAYSTYRFTTDR